MTHRATSDFLSYLGPTLLPSKLQVLNLVMMLEKVLIVSCVDVNIDSWQDCVVEGGSRTSSAPTGCSTQYRHYERLPLRHFLENSSTCSRYLSQTIRLMFKDGLHTTESKMMNYNGTSSVLILSVRDSKRRLLAYQASKNDKKEWS